jgi:hypothetical protein
MCTETGKPEKAVQNRLDATKLSVHCLYDIALNDASDGNMVRLLKMALTQDEFQAMPSCDILVREVCTVGILSRTCHEFGAVSESFFGQG